MNRLSKRWYISPVKVRLPAPKPKKVKPKKYKPCDMTFEEAMIYLRTGDKIRRAYWHPESYIIRDGDEIKVHLPELYFGSRLHLWKPYSTDFLATDWEIR